ncbi:hypothetical protein FGO68_gene4047 [Halteria grandinella]|uniref:Uncharacterized protein n=1 Tax=Halteria grandinella TaxID=5974 RepID=A0A8J8T435_HALGN|nr:hypothetical protein FGO68_gene4047 [Halteria grandinella]
MIERQENRQRQGHQTFFVLCRCFFQFVSFSPNTRTHLRHILKIIYALTQNDNIFVIYNYTLLHTSIIIYYKYESLPISHTPLRTCPVLHDLWSS